VLLWSIDQLSGRLDSRKESAFLMVSDHQKAPKDSPSGDVSSQSVG
jgi:hypothetical protein